MSMTPEASSFSVTGPSPAGPSHNGLCPFQGHDEGIYAVCYSPDGRKIATGGEDIRIWDSNTGEMLIETQYYFGEVSSLCYSPDGKWLVSGHWDGGIHIWSAINGELILHVEVHSYVSTIAYSPDGQHIASGGYGTVKIWHAEDMAEMIEFPEYLVESVSFSPDGHRLATGCSKGNICVIDIVTGALVMPPLEGHTDAVRAVVYSPDGMRLASCSDDCTIRVWDALTGAMLLGSLDGHSSSVYCLAYSPDGKQLVSGSLDNTIRFWEPETGKLIGGPFRGHGESIATLSFAPDGTRFVTGSCDGSMRVWDAWTLDIVSPEVSGPFRGHAAAISAVAYFPDGDRIASTSYDGSFHIWDVHTGEQLGRLIVRGCHSVAISSDGSRLVSGGVDIRVWDTRSGRLVLGPLEGHSGYVSCVRISPDNKFIASSDSKGYIFLWNVQTAKQLRSVKAHNDYILTLSFSADGRRLASGGSDKSICVWDVLTMQMVAGPFKGHTRSINSVAFSPDGLCIASGSCDATVRVWDAKTGSLLRPLRPHLSGASSVSYSPDGTRICSTSYNGTVCLWHATTGDLVLGPLQDPKGEIRSTAFSPDGKNIVTGSEHGTIKFWDVATGEIMQFPGRSTSERLSLDDELSRSLDEFYNHFLQSPRNADGHPHPQQAQGAVVERNYAHASTHAASVSHFQLPNTEPYGIVESGPSDQPTLIAPFLHNLTPPVPWPSNTTPVDLSLTSIQSIPSSEIKPIVDTGLREVATHLTSKGWRLTYSIDPISPVASSLPGKIPRVMLPSSSSNTTDVVVDHFQHVAPPPAERTAACSLEIGPAEDGNPRKTHKIAQVKQLLMDMLQKIQFPVRQRRFPWSTLKDEIERHGYSIINWPHDVPRLNDKGIYSLTVTQADTLYRALTQPNESDRVRFGPRTEDSATNSSSTEETTRSKRPIDSEDYDGRNKKSKFKVMTPANFAGPSK